MKTLISGIVFIIAAIIVWWSITDRSAYNDHLQPVMKQPYLEIFMDNFKITALNSLGQVDYILSGKRIERYHNSENATAFLPVFKFLQQNNQWLITAKTAIINQKNNTIKLSNNVVMQQQNQPQAIKITSQTMLINTLTQTASTNSPIEFLNGQSKMQSTGMIFYHRKNVFELNRKVHGFYLNTPSNDRQTNSNNLLESP